MSLSLKERRAVVKEISVRYKKVKKKEKGKILDEFVKLTGYNRCYASYLLRTYEKKVVIYGKDGIRRDKNKKRNRKRVYGGDILNALIYLWYLSDFLCGKRLVPYIREVLPHLKRHSELHIMSTTVIKYHKQRSKIPKNDGQKFALSAV